MPPIADASLTDLRYAKEITYGVPVTTAYQSARMVSETLGQDKEVVQSDEIVSDRRPPDNIQTGSSASGEIVTEVIGGGFNVAGGQKFLDDWWLASIGQSTVFSNTAQNQGFSAGTMTITNSGTDRITILLTGTTPATWPSGFADGTFFAIRGLLTASDSSDLTYLNGIYQVVTGQGTATLTLTKGARLVTSPKTTPTLTAGTTVSCRRVPDANDGTSLQFFTFERKYSLTNEFARLPGFAFNGFRFEMRPKQPMRITWNLIGREESSAAAQLGSSVDPAPTNKSFSPVSDFRWLSLGEDGHSFSVTSFTLDVKGGLYPLDEEAGVLGPQGIGVGTFDITGEIEFYYEGGTLHSFYQAFTEKSLHFGAMNANGDGLLFAMPRVNFTNPGRRSVPGKDQAIKGTVGFRAAKGTDTLPAPDETYLLKIGRL